MFGAKRSGCAKNASYPGNTCQSGNEESCVFLPPARGQVLNQLCLGTRTLRRSAGVNRHRRTLAHNAPLVELDTAGYLVDRLAAFRLPRVLYLALTVVCVENRGVLRICDFNRELQR